MRGLSQCIAEVDAFLFKHELNSMTIVHTIAALDEDLKHSSIEKGRIFPIQLVRLPAVPVA
jgi:hypothetical protein